MTGYLPQTFELQADATVHTNILAGAQHVLDLIAEYERTDAEAPRSGELLHQIDHFDGLDRPSTARQESPSSPICTRRSPNASWRRSAVVKSGASPSAAR